MKAQSQSQSQSSFQPHCRPLAPLPALLSAVPVRRMRGFTLIEIMIVVVIVAMLGAIAVPAYNGYVVRGKIPEATSALAARRVQMEQFFQDNRTYINAPACPSSTTPNTTASPYFDFSCAADPTATTYTIQAVGKNSMVGFTFTIDQDNTKKTTAVPSSGGWATSTSCWVTKPGDAC